MPLASGVFNTTGNPTELNKRSFADKILRLFPNGSAPLFGITSQTGDSKAVSSTHGYFSKTMAFLTITLGAGALVGDAAITIPATSGITASMVFYNTRTREVVRVTADAGNNAVSMNVTRAFGRIAAAAMNAGDKLIQIGTAFAEGSTRPTARRLTTVYVANYTQIFRNAWALTDTARASLADMGFSNVAENRKDCGLMHSVDIECAIIWGQPKMDTSGTQPLHATQGILDAMEQYAPANTNTAGATTNYDQLITMLEPAFAYSTDMSNPKERALFGDSLAVKVINEIGRKSGQVQITQNESVFGMHFTKFKFYKGTVNIIEHPLLNGLGTAGMAIVLDTPALRFAYMEGRKTKPEEYGTGGKIVESGVDSVGGSLTTEGAVELINPYACAVIEGLTAGAA